MIGLVVDYFFIFSFLMISDFAPEQVLFDLTKKTIKVL
jgi:hypothetical protein